MACPKAVICQIYYDEASRNQLEPGFIPLDNSRNERPDWREYWPIRNYLLNHELDEDAFYAFLSPKFSTKTGLTTRNLFDFLHQLDDRIDVAIFSAYWDAMALYWNVLEQGEYWHPGLQEVAREFFSTIYPNREVVDIPTSAGNTIFSNYFAARPAFWRRWLAVNEKLFLLSESGAGKLAERLNAKAKYEADVQFKVFIMERVASIILAMEPDWHTATYNPYQLKSSLLPSSQFLYEAVLSDALKLAYANNGYAEYKQAYHHLRQVLNNKNKPN